MRIRGIRNIEAAKSAATVLLLGLGACSFAPDPEPLTPVETLPEAFAEATIQGEYTPREWWTSFQDPTLDALVDTVLVANLDLAEAVARVEESRALAGIATADLYPSLTGSANVSRQDNPVNAGFGAIIGAILGGALPGDSTGTEPPPDDDERPEAPTRSQINSYDASLSLSYELDFWGRARNDRRAALADLEASASDYQIAQLGVLGEAITAYFDLVDLEDRIALTEEIVDVLDERETLSVVRYNRGLVSSFELYTVRQDRQAAQASVPQLRGQLGDARRRLALVSGRHLEELNALLGEEREPVIASEPIPPGLPADLLWQRPDVRSSAARLEAARLRVGARKAELLPSITLSGTLGLQSATSEGLFDISQWFSNLAAGLTQPLFQGGRLRSNLDAAEARYAQQIAAHGRTVLTAMGEAETALLRYEEELDRYRILADQLEQAEASVSLQSRRYRAGVGAYTDYLDALRILLNTQSTVSSSARDVALARLGVHRALGGGWAELPGEALADPDESTGALEPDSNEPSDPGS
jgi:multidrug efflux system outer membrane protein